MQKHTDLTLRRLQMFASDQLSGRIYTRRAPVSLSVFHAPGRITYAEALAGTYEPAAVGQRFGPIWSTHWFRVEIAIPADWTGQEVHLLWDSGSEGQVWVEGHPVQGLAGSGIWGAAAPIRGETVIARPAAGGENLSLYIELAANNLFGEGFGKDTGLTPSVGYLRLAEIAIFDRAAWDLYWDFQVLADMADNLPRNSSRGAQALYAANAMVNLLDLDDRSTWAPARAIAARYFGEHTGQGQLDLSAVGHAHIDTAWLWPLSETRRKCMRTFSTAVAYMDDYPAYIFACSQAQQFEWTKELYPDLYEKIKAKVQSGQFAPAGGSWVEPDCNLPSGEALVRQFYYGQRLFRQEFGITCEEFWEPDVFGYSAALPQILRQSGIRYFLTIKLSWNQFNKLPSHTFWWEGIDGSRVLTHFPPADTYNSFANVKEVAYSASNYKDLDRSRDAYLLFGYGDGGGGPTRGMLEQLARMADVDGLPRVQMRTPNAFFKRLEQNSTDLLTWAGELYFELHRATYTTHAHNKKFNRQSEFMLHDVEFLAATALAVRGAEYPAANVDGLWKRVLTNQFHDIIPGSSIHMVYEDSDLDYADILQTGASLRANALDDVLAPAGGSILHAVNTTSFDRREVVELPAGASGLQASAGGAVLAVAVVPAYGYAPLAAAAPVETVSARQEKRGAGDCVILENALVAAVFQADGSLVSLFDKRANREAVEPGKQANHFVLYDDNPTNWDAWDVDVFHLEKRTEAGPAKTCRIVEAGPLRAAVVFEYDLSAGSSLVQTVSLSALSARLDFDTRVDWHERHRFLKVEFPINVRSARATYEIQFGQLERPTHFNTSWDMARFEVVAHKWADLSDPNFGVALFNDCKYGHAVHGSVMRLSLLRGPTMPDAEADQGLHSFRYALLAHTGTPQQAGLVAEGYAFNAPLIIRAAGADLGARSFFRVDNPAVVLDTVKKAGDSAEIVVRMYESHGAPAAACLKVDLPVESVVRCNLLEDEAGPRAAWGADGLALALKPFELATFKLKLK